MRKRALIEINLDDSSMGTVVINGKDISQAIQSIIFEAVPGQVPRLLMEMKGIVNIKTEADISTNRANAEPAIPSKITPWVSAASTASRLGIAYITLSKMRMRGEGPAYSKIGSAIRYRNEDIEAYIRARTRS